MKLVNKRQVIASRLGYVLVDHIGCVYQTLEKIVFLESF